MSFNFVSALRSLSPSCVPIFHYLELFNDKNYFISLKSYVFNMKSHTLTCLFSVVVLSIVTIHVHYNNAITGENLYSKLSLVDLAGSECLTMDTETGKRVTELLHVMQSLSA